MRKLIVVKNAYLDNLCYSSLIQKKEGQRIEIQGKNIEFIVVRQEVRGSTEDNIPMES